jgi:anti-anti-sigma factor
MGCPFVASITRVWPVCPFSQKGDSDSSKGEWMEKPESAPFALAVRASDGSTVVELAGDFDLSGADEFRSCIEALIGSSNGQLLVDLGDVTFIDSCAIAALLEMRRLVAREHRELRLQRISAPVSRLLELTGLTDLFEDSASPSI